MVLLYAPQTYASIKAGRNHDLANPRKMEEHLAKDDSVDKAVSTLSMPPQNLSPFLYQAFLNFLLAYREGGL